MNLKIQNKLIRSIIENKEKINKKEKWIKILDSNFITRFFFHHTINILELEVIQLNLKQITTGLKGMIDCKTSSSSANRKQEEKDG